MKKVTMRLCVGTDSTIVSRALCLSGYNICFVGTYHDNYFRNSVYNCKSLKLGYFPPVFCSLVMTVFLDLCIKSFGYCFACCIHSVVVLLLCFF